MFENSTGNTPSPLPPSSAAAPAPAPDITPAPPADLMNGLSSLAAPGNQPTVQGTQEYQGYSDAVAQQQAAAKRAQELASAPVIPPDAPHAKLLGMVSALATGLSAFGTSLATKGAEGGAKEVAQIQGEQQRQKLETQSAAMNQRNQQIQQQLTIAGTNQTLAQSYLNLLSVPDEIESRHLAVQAQQQNLTTGAQAAQIQLADFMKSNWGFTPNEMTGAQTGQTTTAADPAHIQNAQAMLTRTVGDPNDPKTTGAVAILGADNPAVKAALAVAQDPKATVQSILAAGQGLSVALQQNSQVTASKKASADATKAQVDAANAPALSAANIAKAQGQGASARAAQAKSAFELTQEQHEATDLSKPDVAGFSSPLTEKEYDKRYDAFTKSKDYQTLSTLKGSYQQFNDTLNHIAQTGDMTGAESVVGLFNAIGISATPLAGKGFRINANTVSEHAEARGIDQAAYQKLLALKNGDVITPKQLQDYSNIAAGVYHNAYVNAADEAHREGLPVDFLPQGGGQQVDPITARIYMDVILHSNPALANNPKAAQAAAKQAAAQNGWAVQ
jgi:hypothetical protein